MNLQPHISMRRIKVALVTVAVLIAAVSLLVSHQLIADLQQEEVDKMEVWAEAMRSLMSADGSTDLNLVLKVINSNRSIPVVVTDEADHVTTHRNLPISANTAVDSAQAVTDYLHLLKEHGKSMQMLLTPDAEMGIGKNETITLYYDESVMLRRLSTYPYVQLGVVSLFVVVAIFALLSSKRAEQNKVWVGLSKETAHQLGTPISSLMAWTEILKESYPDDELLHEMETDVKRLEMIAERFSKVGSTPELQPTHLAELVENVRHYLARRTSNKVKFRICNELTTDLVPLSAPLFEWVLEVLCKNAIDAMSGEGTISLRLFANDTHHCIDLTDTGKGIARKNFATVFRPGFTTKQRGWGLGLSLAKRIVEEYHHGKIYVKYSELNVGTTFRIELRTTPT